jgi:DNA-binding NtrC family response regulator
MGQIGTAKISKVPNLEGLSILIVDDDPSSIEDLPQRLKEFGAQVYIARNSHDAKLILNNRIHAIMSGLKFVDEDFIERVKSHKARYPESFFYVLTEPEYDSIEPSSEFVRLYVDDYIQKPVDVIRFARMFETSMGRPSTGDTSLTIIDPLVAKVKPYFIFRSTVMRRVLRHLPEIAQSGQTVLITGETGTGKEIVARAIHVLSPRASNPFVAINCGAIPESLIEGELFGHEKGAFTGALRTRKGKFEIANNGTLFLDEIGDMPLNLQVRLLRVLEEGNIYRVGGETPVPINVRVIAASHMDLRKAVEDGLFRADLYYRLNILRLHLPPLRERIEDISLLAVHFLERAFSEMGWQKPYPTLSSETIYLLEHYPWKGNIRELRNVMTRVATMLPKNTKRIFPFHILPHLEDTGYIPRSAETEKQGEGVFIPIGTHLDDAEDLIIKETLRLTNGNKTKAAKMLGISLRTLRRKLNKTSK